MDLHHLLELWDTQKGLCALSGVAMTHTSRPADDRRLNVSLDRIDSSRNYLKSNVQLVTQIANISKHSLKQDDFVHLCTQIACHQGRAQRQEEDAEENSLGPRAVIDETLESEPGLVAAS